MKKYNDLAATQHFQKQFANSNSEKYFPISLSLSSSSVSAGSNSSTSSSPGCNGPTQDDPFLSQSQTETQHFLVKRPDNANQLRKTSIPIQPLLHQRTRYISETGTDTTYISNSSSINQVGRNLQFAYQNKNAIGCAPQSSSDRVLCDERFDDPSYGNRSFSLLRNVYIERKSGIQLTFLLILLGVTAAVATILVLKMIGAEADSNVPGDFNTSITSVKEGGMYKMGQRDTVSKDILGLGQELESGYDSTPPPYQNRLPKAAPIHSIQTRNNPRKVPRDVLMPHVATTENYPNSRTSTKFPVVKAKRQNIKPMSNFPDLDANTSNNNRQPINYMQINSAADFKKLESTPVEAISIKHLVDVPEGYSNEKHVHLALGSRETEQITNLKISGPITEEWLSCILKKFDKIENLAIDVDEMCTGATSPDRDSLEILKLKNVQSLQIENLHKCAISSWIFKWELPNIQKLRIHNSTLTKKMFEPIHRFLERRKNVLNSVVISKSFTCPECSFSDVQYTNLESIEIKDPSQVPLLSRE